MVRVIVRVIVVDRICVTVPSRASIKLHRVNSKGNYGALHPKIRQLTDAMPLWTKAV